MWSVITYHVTYLLAGRGHRLGSLVLLLLVFVSLLLPALVLDELVTRLQNDSRELWGHYVVHLLMVN